MPPLKMTSYLDSNMPWEDVLNPVTGKTIQRKHFLQDADTGMEVMVVKYPTGVITPKHTHPCAHGLYVVSGKLYTHDGIYGPGDFVWYPEGVIGEHGATDDGPVTLVFMTNKPFDISFV
jgi:quercetin dioxygenase-like cupin family protein